MNKISQESVYKVVSDSGFVRIKGKRGLFLVGEPRIVTPAFYCNVVRKRGMVRLGGGIGLFFRDFETMWSATLSKEEKAIDATLPLIMLIDNFLELIDNNVFRYSDLGGIVSGAHKIRNLVSGLPNSIDAFDKALVENELLGKPVSDYLHIFDYHDDDNIYYKKSVSFVHWFMCAYPKFAGHLRQCLTSLQLQRLGLR